MQRSTSSRDCSATRSRAKRRASWNTRAHGESIGKRCRSSSRDRHARGERPRAQRPDRRAPQGAAGGPRHDARPPGGCDRPDEELSLENSEFAQGSADRDALANRAGARDRHRQLLRRHPGARRRGDRRSRARAASRGPRRNRVRLRLRQPRARSPRQAHGAVRLHVSVQARPPCVFRSWRRRVRVHPERKGDFPGGRRALGAGKGRQHLFRCRDSASRLERRTRRDGPRRHLRTGRAARHTAARLRPAQASPLMADCSGSSWGEAGLHRLASIAAVSSDGYDREVPKASAPQSPALVPIPEENRPLPAEPREQQRIAYSTCYMCACRCGIKLTINATEAGEQVRFIQGTRAHPVNQGVLCAKGSAGIMKQLSPAKLRKPLLRRPGAKRGEARFDEIEWDAALSLITERLKRIRSTDPRQLAFFTGRDQMQALTGLWAQQFGTPNWAAHGGFCSVNMAAAGLYTIGYSFWEFGAPDWDRAKYFVLWGVAEDHSSNPIKIGLDKLKRNGAKFVSINPVRTGYSAIADQWIPIRPGTDGLLALSIVHVLLADGTIDFEFLARYTNAPWLVMRAPGSADDGLFARDREGRPLVFDDATGTFTGAVTFDTRPALFGTHTLREGPNAGCSVKTRSEE